jgi:uncharacterized YccA/Bax inhibitor family protein
MRTSNPMLTRLSEAARATGAAARSERMTIAGTATRATILLAVVLFSATLLWQQINAGRTDLIMPAMLIGGIGGFVVALVAIFKPQTAPYTAPIYASLQGVFLGAVSAMYNLQYAGLPQQAVALTFVVAAAVFVLYRMGVLRATQGFRRMIVAATVGIGLFYIVQMLMSLFGMNVWYFSSNSMLAIGINVFIAGIAALNLVLDFDLIEEGVRSGAPKQMEWFAAFELLRLLSRLQGRRE